MIKSNRLIINNWYVSELEKKIITSEFPRTSTKIDAKNPTYLLEKMYNSVLNGNFFQLVIL